MKLKIRNADGTDKIIDVKGKGMTLDAHPGATYRPIDEKTARTPRTAVLKRVRDDLLIENAQDRSSLTLYHFFSECSPSDRCWAVLDAGTTGDATVTVTQDGDVLTGLAGGQSGAMADGQ